MDSITRLKLANQAWVQYTLDRDPLFFEKLKDGQHPEFLWIGCSDSRIPSDTVVGTGPGEMFVHRNIANMIIHTDFNMLSVLEFAVKTLRVKHIILCGHYNCGGVRAAMSQQNLGLLNKWLRHIKDVYRFHHVELEAIRDEGKRYNRLVELNVVEQVHHLAETSVVQQSWHEFNSPHLHGWVFDTGTGLVKEIMSLAPGSSIEDIYMFDFGQPNVPLPSSIQRQARR
jgi:carbonic anhydrase